MNAPHRKLDSRLFEGFPPGEDVLIDAIDESAVEIEQESGAGFRDSRLLLLLLPLVLFLDS
jgi:hypothetical protein